MRTNGRPSVMAAEAGEHDVIEGDFDDMPRGGRGGGGALATVRAGAGMQQIKTQYMTAIRCEVPRDLTKVVDKVVKEAGLAGEDFLYSWSQGEGNNRSIIEGVSIDGAMIMARNYGNCVPEVDIVEEGPDHWTFRATFIDFETGATLPRLLRKSKSGVRGKMDRERKLDIAFQIGQSKAQRNVIVKAMPTYLVKKAVDAAKAAAAAEIKDLPKAIGDATAAFAAKFKVTAEQLEGYLGVPRDQWNKLDVVRLRATYRALIDRQTTVDDEFPRPGQERADDEPPAVTTPDKQEPAQQQQQQQQGEVPPQETNMFTGEPNVSPQPQQQAAQPATQQSAQPAAQPSADKPAEAKPADPVPEPTKDAPKAETPKSDKPKGGLKLKGEREPGGEG